MEWLIPLYELALLIVPIYTFVVLLRRVKHKVLSRARAFAYYLGWVSSPIALFILLFLGAVGVEEVTGIALVTEGLGRGLLILLALGLAVWLLASMVFATVLLVVGRKTGQ